MLTRRFALIMGIVFLAIGVLGFVPGINSMHHDHPTDNLRVEGPGHGYLLGLFHVNVLHNLVHLVFGVLGVLAWKRFDSARGYARFVAVSYAVLAVLGLIPTANTWNTWGLIPIHGHDVWLHVAIAGAAAYFGFMVHARDVPTHGHGHTPTHA